MTEAFAKHRASVGPRGFRTLRSCCWSLLLGVAACGPIGYLQQVHGKARDAVTDARRAGAESAAPYEYTSAVEYLKKAEEEGDHAEYQVAIEYGRQAQSFAARAKKLADEAKTDEAKADEAKTDEAKASTADDPEGASARQRKGSP